MDQYLMYLRKSRKDIEAEERGEGETLARHQKTLLELAKAQHFNVTEIYSEIVSGETIAARPVMQKVLSEVEQGIWTGVLVMEVERLARGDTIDQGIVAQTFKFSNTKIITPMKTYDPNNEYDEEYFEFGLFMSRREYKTINRRLQRGRIASVKEGKYVANQPPYGYRRIRIENGKGFTLAPQEGEAEIIRLIFEWYTVGILQEDGSRERIGVARIVRKLNEMKIQPRKGKVLVEGSVRDILINPVYMGMVRWNWRPAVKKMSEGNIIIERPRSNEVILYKGLHQPLISKETFDLAQEYISNNRPVPVPGGYRNKVMNPLAGIVICGKCGRHMIRRPYRTGYPDSLMCPVTSCDNVSSALALVESKILEYLREWLGEYKLKWETDNFDEGGTSILKQKAISSIDKDLVRIDKQLDSAHDLLEQGIYDVDVFLERSRRLTEQKDADEKRRAALEKELAIEKAREINQKNVIPKVEHLLEVYDSLSTPKAKNDLLKDVLEKVVYTKKAGGRWHNPEDFELDLYPKLPEYGTTH